VWSGTELVGRTIAGKFRIEAVVGRGSMGCVYRATQLNLQKAVAIKVLDPSKPAGGPYAARFKREAKAASRLDHPNSLRILDFGEDQGLLYMAMEYLCGRDLLTVLRADHPLPKERIVSVLSQALAALAVAHEMGVVHRDLKPENVMLLPSKDDDGNAVEIVKVCDFGIAKLVESDVDAGADAAAGSGSGTLTAYGMLLGTPEYMSPEQARGLPADPRSDIYSLGVVLYQMLTGRLPFAAKTKIQLVIKQVEERAVPPHELDSKVDLGLDAVCMKALEKHPADRFQNAREMRAALRSALEGDASLADRLARSRPSASLDRPDRPLATPSAELPAPTLPAPSPRVPMSDVDLVADGTDAALEDPQEAAAALIEARKLLHVLDAPATARVGAVRRQYGRKLAVGVAAVVLGVAAVWLATR